MTTQTAPTGTDTAQQPSSKPLTEAEMRAYGVPVQVVEVELLPLDHIYLLVEVMVEMQMDLILVDLAA